MKYSLKILRPAIKGMRRLPASVQSQMDARIRELADNPRPRDCTKLSGQADAYRIKVAKDYRIVYLIDDDRRQVAVRFIAHRREIYRDL